MVFPKSFFVVVVVVVIKRDHNSQEKGEGSKFRESTPFQLRYVKSSVCVVLA